MIHYISCHSVLEYDEVKLLSELGYKVFSNGAYTDPAGAYTLPRPGIPRAEYYPHLASIARSTPKTNLPKELIDPFDTFIIMHSPEVLLQNWDRIKHKRVIWRTIGQSTSGLEAKIAPLVKEGLQIVRYSPMEQNLKNYAGQHKLIRFYKDPNEFKGWTGEDNTVINFTQSLMGRRDFCHYDTIMPIIQEYKGKIYGTGNDNLGKYNGGELPYEMQKEQMRKAGAMIYGGTWPASYTLSLMEAMMTGLPIVAVGGATAQNRFEKWEFYEIPSIIQQGISGFWSDDTQEMIKLTKNLLTNRELAEKISRGARKMAIRLFSKDVVAPQWRDLLNEDHNR